MQQALLTCVRLSGNTVTAKAKSLAGSWSDRIDGGRTATVSSVRRFFCVHSMAKLFSLGGVVREASRLPVCPSTGRPTRTSSPFLRLVAQGVINQPLDGAMP